MTRFHFSFRFLGLAAFIVGLAPSVWAKDYKKIVLDFRPQETVSSTTVVVPAPVTKQPIRLVTSDHRDLADDLIVGAQMDDANVSFQYRATEPVLPSVSGFVALVLREWFVTLGEEAPLRLNLELAQYYVTETEYFVGSSYSAVVAFRASLRDVLDHELWSGNVRGESSRYGQDGSADNCNEVLSDALKSALAMILQDQSLLNSWGSGAAGEKARSVVSPDQLLEDLVRLKAAGVGLELLTGLAEQATLSGPLTADDVLKWKGKEIPESVIALVLRKASHLPGEK